MTKKTCAKVRKRRNFRMRSHIRFVRISDEPAKLTHETRNKIKYHVVCYHPIKIHRTERRRKKSPHQNMRNWCDSAYYHEVDCHKQCEQCERRSWRWATSKIKSFFFLRVERKSMSFYVFHRSILRTSFHFLVYFFLVVVVRYSHVVAHQEPDR